MTEMELDAKPDTKPEEVSGDVSDRHEFRPSTLTVCLQPEEKTFELPRAQCKNVGQLLKTLGLRQATAFVARDGTLLTPDVPLYPGQTLLVRTVMSSG